MSEHQEPNSLRAAEPWLRTNAERLVAKLFTRDAEDEEVTEMILFQLKRAYAEGYADRLKDEAKESKSPEPKRRVQRRKK